MSEGKLAGRHPAAPSRAAAGAVAAQLLAEAAQGVEERHRVDPPRWRQMPRLHPFAVGDQITVVATDLCAALDGVGPVERVWTRDGRRPGGEMAAEVLESLCQLRLSL